MKTSTVYGSVVVLVSLIGLAFGVHGLLLIQNHSWGESYVTEGAAEILFGILLILLGNTIIQLKTRLKAEK